MNEETASLDRIRALHAGILTRGDWKAWDRGIGWEVHNDNDEPLNSGFRETFAKGDAAFIAAAPSIVAQLLAKIEAVEKIAASMDRIADFNLSILPHDDMGISLKQHAEDIRAAITGEGRE